MNKCILIFITLSLLYVAPVNAQGGLLKKVTGAMKDELLGTNKSGDSKNKGPEPSCACDAPEVILDLGGKVKLNYGEITICSKDDGSLLVQDRVTASYYIVKGSVTQGPMQAGDARITGFRCDDSANADPGSLLTIYKEYISKSGDKYVINFGGKTYGPYAQINQFAVSKSKGQFAALIIENIVATEDEGKKMDEAIKNAKTEQEKMELAMQYSQQITQKMLQGGGPSSMTPKLITSVPDALSDFMSFMGSNLNADAKFDEVVLFGNNKVTSLQGKDLITLKPENYGASNIFINSGNSRYALYNYGSLTFSDGKNLTDLMNPLLIKSGNQVYITYMYYSPKRNAIVQCKIPF